jgi:superoxide dismutase, Cu-Zn family
MNRLSFVSTALAAAFGLLACDSQTESTPLPDHTTVTAPTAPVATAKPAQGTDPAAPPAVGEVLVDPGAPDAKRVTKAIAVLQPLGEGKTKGTVAFEATDGGLKMKTTVEGLPAKKHAYHVHLLGDCSAADGQSAGTHFHFSGPSKNPPADIKIITGDLGDLEGDSEGKSTHEATIEGASLQGKFSILGRSIIVHEKPNDPNDPPIGGAGGRIACGVIGITE